MGDIQLFKLSAGGVAKLEGKTAAVERSLQQLFERHLDDLLGIRFLASEYSTGSNHGGRIDTLGLDENGCPVIIEYKRSVSENVINQGLFYLDWLLDHEGDIRWLVSQKYGSSVADGVQFSASRLICVAGDYTRYDDHAIRQINRNIELVRYMRFGQDMLLLELVASTFAPIAGSGGSSPRYTTVSELLDRASVKLKDLFWSLDSYLTGLGDDVQKNTLRFYFAYKRLRNFCCVEVHPQSERLKVYVKVDPDSIVLEYGFTRDVRDVGHFGTGDLEISIAKEADIQKAQSLLLASYDAS